MRVTWGFIVAVLLCGTVFQFIASKGYTSGEVLPIAEHIPSVSVTLAGGLDRQAIVAEVGMVLGYDEKTVSQLHDTYRSMQWDAFNDVLVPYIVEENGLTEKDTEILFTHAAVYLDVEEDVLEPFYIPGTYTFSAEDTVVSVAAKLIEPLLTEKATHTLMLLKESSVESLLAYIGSERELLPDLVPLPPQDIVLREEGGRRLLTFTTIYYNGGKGNLELRADPKTIGTAGDFERVVFQRIYRDDGSYRERDSGTFEWHQEHLHYHFSDFIEYRLEAVDGGDTSEVLAEKSTFCIRDVSRVEVNDVPSTTPAEYRICGRERQGVTVGWGDAYFNTYVDQNLDITALPTGTYRLIFVANPADRFDERTKDNNVSSATIVYDKEEGTVVVESTLPSDVPEFEHIHIEQDL